MDRVLRVCALLALSGNVLVVLGVGFDTASNLGAWQDVGEHVADAPAPDAGPKVSGPAQDVDCATIRGHLMDAAAGLDGDYTARVEALGDDCGPGDPDVELLRSAIRDRYLRDGASLPPSLRE